MTTDQPPHPTVLSSIQLLKMVQPNHHCCHPSHSPSGNQQIQEEEKEYIYQHPKQSHSILIQFPPEMVEN